MLAFSRVVWGLLGHINCRLSAFNRMIIPVSAYFMLLFPWKKCTDEFIITSVSAKIKFCTCQSLVVTSGKMTSHYWRKGDIHICFVFFTLKIDDLSPIYKHSPIIS